MTGRHGAPVQIPWSDYVVHLPMPHAFGAERAAEKAKLLEKVRYFLLVGSLMRPRRIAQHVAKELGMPWVGTYFNLLDDHAVADREFNIEVVGLGTDPDVHVAIVSHGIGGSGAEIVLRELSALVHVAQEAAGNAWQPICGVGRSGTRGTLADIAYGTIGISSASFRDDFTVSLPDPTLQAHLVAAATESGFPYALGKGISTDLFWTGQGRVTPREGFEPAHIRETRLARAQAMLWSWVEAGIEFIEMEDFTVHAVCHSLGIPSVSAGAIVARRFDAAQGAFVLDYDAEAKERSELLPAIAILRAFASHWRVAQG